MTPLWGNQRNNIRRPIWLNDEDLKKTFATERGWCKTAAGNDNPDATPEVLVCVNRLNETTGGAVAMGIQVPTGTYLGTTDVDIIVRFSEPVMVDGAPYIQATVVSGTFVGNGRFVYHSGRGTHEITFRYTLDAGDEVSGITIGTSITLPAGSRIIDNTPVRADADLTLTACGQDRSTNLRAAANTELASLILTGEGGTSSSSSSASSNSSSSNSSSSTAGSFSSSSEASFSSSSEGSFTSSSSSSSTSGNSSSSSNSSSSNSSTSSMSSSSESSSSTAADALESSSSSSTADDLSSSST